MGKFIAKTACYGIAFTCLIFLLPLTAAEDTSSIDPEKINPPVLMNISDITPVKNGMNIEEARDKIKDFLKNQVLTPENLISSQDIIDEGEIILNSGRMLEVITLKDQTTWVKGAGCLQRFVGALYLKKAIQAHNLNQWQAVESKIRFSKNEIPPEITVTAKPALETPLKNLLTINSRNLISYSQYVGDTKPVSNPFDANVVLLPLKTLQELTGYHDFAAYANFRVQEGNNKVTIIDTEYGSFSSDNLPPSQPTELAINGATFVFPTTDFLQ
jgi:hypothetical protein